MSAEAPSAWVKTPATHGVPGGQIIFIHVAERLVSVVATIVRT